MSIRPAFLPHFHTLHIWPVILFSIPFAAVLFGILMITVATMHPDDLVADAYYKEGLAINEDLIRDRAADERNIRAVLVHEAGTDATIVTLHNTWDTGITLEMAHVSDASQDFVVTGSCDNGRCVLEHPALASAMGGHGVWYVAIENTATTWRVAGRVVTPSRQIVIE